MTAPKLPPICPQCRVEATTGDIVCPRDVDVACLHCGVRLCAAHMPAHLRGVHCVALTLDHCSRAPQTPGIVPLPR